MGFRQRWQLEDQRWITDGNFKITAIDCPYILHLKNILAMISYFVMPDSLDFLLMSYGHSLSHSS